MTRETKIGLLVGLGFIIIIGVLLSDHIQTATEPPQAQLAVVGSTVRSAVNTPGTSGAGAAPVAAPDTIAPFGSVRTQEDLANQPAPTQVIKIGPADPAPVNPPAAHNDVLVSRTPEVAPLSASNVELVPVPSRHVADARPLPLETSTTPNTMDPGLFTPKGAEAKPPETAKPVAKAVERTYTAAAGDTVSKMAAKFYGSKEKKYVDLIVAANKDLKGRADFIVAGRTYIIPAKPVELSTTDVKLIGSPTQTPAPEIVKVAPTALTEATTPVVIAPPTTPATPAATETPAPAGTRWYTVKAKDNLWKIAQEQLGSGSPKNINQIKELNKGVIKGDSVRENMKIKLPAKQVAAAD